MPVPAYIIAHSRSVHKDPVSKKWQLVNDFTDHLYLSASYYEKGIKQYDKLLHVNEVLLIYHVAFKLSYPGVCPLHPFTLRLPRGKTPGGRKQR